MIKKLLFPVLMSALFLVMNLQSYGQKYDPKYGNTTYPNGTTYLSHAENKHGENMDPIVSAVDENGKSETVDCADDPDRCKELLEAAADDAAAREQSETKKEFSAGMGGDKEFNDWLNNRGEWPNLPPLHFPDAGPTRPIPGREIVRWTNHIIKGL